ncbi:pyruvate, water dikinase regulatory protein [Alteribacillus bidgolensis]|uniref:Putative pyruvate, phosphate dikinase regulatory protein n=1 Tax=Alteribacillus bidgolensis TaxID=930129 RepID=A0A1G8S7F7_9BACI|nr:pyruvate, water dikinase regulatory protein [Alteribacillus bidgolensis]SDJ25149.1 hypothetical protein SAMN05216352_1442 [Alteribacillus bidgolensis]
MSSTNNQPIVYLLSDLIGETAELAVKAAASQFNLDELELIRIQYVEDKETIMEIISLAKEQRAIIAYTLVVPEIKDYLVQQAASQSVTAINIMGLIIKQMQQLLYQTPDTVHQLGDEYFRKIDAIEFINKYDDGRDPKGILKADVVLIGISRTSKTPISQYLANKQIKVANVPIVPEVRPPEELFQVSENKCFGLFITPDKLADIRKERLLTLGLNSDSTYANIERIKEELDYFEEIAQRIGCRVIDVSNRAIEESSNLIANSLGEKPKNVIL